ncbi:MAG TPA: methylated-DNA--[protein]-cysteine S-methyltransferase [Chitinophagaceae bacterium]|nr:methylated-DNA--[protein]-cysteine S-methyltransferase [Chitinophagaceae bacterium]
MEQPYFVAYFQSPIDWLEIVCNDTGLISLNFRQKKDLPENPSTLTDLVATQLKAYFEGHLKEFDIPLLLAGTAFQQTVWHHLQEIPYGQTISYATLARMYGDINAIRAVANANGKNQHAIIIPCHRVIGSDGSLTGYAGGLERKRWLLIHEAQQNGQTLF